MTLSDKLTALKIPGTVTKTENNGFYTCYHVLFNPDITLAKIKARRDDIALFLDVPVEIETGSGGAVIIKALKERRDPVGVYDFTCKLADGIPGHEIPLMIGTSETGSHIFYDLAKMPHLLAGGSTGSGKSVFMHNCILSTFYSGNCNLMLIDVKRVEFNIYENIPHLITPVIYDPAAAYKQLKNLCYEMDRRYQLLKDNNCRNVKEFRDRGHKLNYIAVFIDELCDLLMNNKKIESLIIRLAQLGRAAGIHLVVATQRPDSVVLSGLIRANIPTRVCFAVQKATDSRIILDAAGGESLRGAGDGLFLPIGNRSPVHFQAPFISTDALINAVKLARRVNDK